MVNVTKLIRQISRYIPVKSNEKALSQCDGIVLEFPPGQNSHIAYPFVLHNELSLPWNYQSTDNKFFLRSKTCSGTFVNTDEACIEV